MPTEPIIPVVPTPPVVPTEPVTPPVEPTVPPADPEFDGDFDEERAKTLIGKLRAEKAAAANARDEYKTKVDAFEASQLSEQEKRDRELAAAKDELAKTRREAALTRYKLPETALVFLTGETAEAIEAQAASLAALAPAPTEPPIPVTTTSRVTPSLPDGQFTQPPAPFDPVAVAAKARRPRF
jgi:hypothetical protein